MKIMVIGNGAREHALVWKFSRSNRLSGLFAAPGNAGTASLAHNLPDIAADDNQAIVRACSQHKIDTVFVGPEIPLQNGIVDALRAEGIAAIGPGAEASRLEADKSYSKRFMMQYGVPTAAYDVFTDVQALDKHVRALDHRAVVKKSGLAAGKGVLETDDKDAMIDFGTAIIESGDSVLIEERLIGYEVSIFALCDGKDYAILPPCTDYKKAGAGGTGPNTGGMGAICPVPWLSPEEMTTILKDVVEPTFKGLRDSGLIYIGVLYFGIMITESGPRVLEYNVRFGDPEAQVVIPLIKTDFGNLCEALVNQGLKDFPIRYNEGAALGVVVAAAGYPSEYEKGLVVGRLPVLQDDEGLVFHASTTVDDGTVKTGGGRCFTAVGLGRELLSARSKAYSVAREIYFPGSWFRPDIGGRIFGS